MLEIQFYMETPKDYITPITIANALIEREELTSAQLEEIAEHLLAYIKRNRIE